MIDQKNSSPMDVSFDWPRGWARGQRGIWAPLPLENFPSGFITGASSRTEAKGFSLISLTLSSIIYIYNNLLFTTIINREMLRLSKVIMLMEITTSISFISPFKTGTKEFSPRTGRLKNWT